METSPRRHWSTRKSIFVLLLDWGIATAAFVLAFSMHHYTGDSIIPGLLSVAAIAIAGVAFVGAPIVTARRSGKMQWLFSFLVAGFLIAAVLLSRAEYHQVRSAHARAKIRTVFRAADQVTKIVPPPLLSSLPRYQENPQRWRAARDQAASRYVRSISRAEPELSRFNIKIVRVLPAQAFLPQIDMSVGTLTFCYTPNPLQTNVPSAILGTCEQPDWDSMVLGFPAN